MKVLTRPEELVLLAAWRLQPDAYGVTIRKYVMEMSQARWSVGAIYDALDRLSLWGMLSSVQADPTPERGGRSKKYFALTRDGYEALVKLKNMHESMWQDLPDPGFSMQTK
ncbi:PadR family transcriptional regulator [bacterium]|nr:PadR family transcriptional regulator [bacterium]